MIYGDHELNLVNHVKPIQFDPLSPEKLEERTGNSVNNETQAQTNYKIYGIATIQCDWNNDCLEETG